MRTMYVFYSNAINKITKITLIAALIEILQGLGCIFYFLTFSVFPLIKRTNFSQMIQLASHLLNPNLLNMQTLWEFKERWDAGFAICYDLMLSLHFTFIHSHCNALAQPLLPAPSYQLTHALAPHIISQTKHTNINMKSWYIYDDFRIKHMIDPEYWLLLTLLHQVLLLVIVYDDHAWSYYS